MYMTRKNGKEACCLLLFNKKRELLIQHRDFNTKYFAGMWGLIGGAVEEGETPEDCIIRECLEETGIYISNLYQLFKIDEHCVEWVYFSQLKKKVSVTCREGIEMKFVNLEELDKYNISCYHKQIIVKAKDYCLKKMESLDDG